MSNVSIHESSVARFLDRLEEAFHDGDGRSAEKAAEAANVRVLIDQYRAIVRNDFAAALALMDDAIEFELYAPPEVPISGNYRGLPAVAEAMGRNYRSLADQEAVLLRVVAQGDDVVLFAEERGSVRATGHTYHIR